MRNCILGMLHIINIRHVAYNGYGLLNIVRLGLGIVLPAKPESSESFLKDDSTFKIMDLHAE